ncbi:hypothetical protein D3C86_1233590 [compost metagenome]
MGRKLEIQHALGIARRFLCQRIVALQQADVPTPRSQAGSRRATGQAGADHQRPTFAGQRCGSGKPGFGNGGCQGVFRPAEEGAAQDLPFVADAWRALHLEACGIQQPAHPSGAGEGAQGRARRGQARQLGEQFGGPHVGVFRRGETVEKPGVDLCIQLRQLLQGIPDQQGQDHSAVVQDKPLEALMDRHVLRQQLLGKGFEFRPQGQRPLQVRQAQRILFDTHEMQPRTRHRLLFEQLPGAEKIQSGAETGLTDHQS